MQTTTATKAGNAPDLLSGILSVQVKNEDKITEQDRIYCQNQQDMLYKTLDRIDRWYAIFKEEAEQYREERKFHYEENGKVSMRDFYSYHNDRDDYSHNEFKPFTTSSNRLTSSMIWLTRTVMPTLISPAVSSPISTRHIMSLSPYRKLRKIPFRWASVQSMKPTWMLS